MNWVNFVGEGRSGHTIISGALGCHPHVRISEEQKYISKWLRGWNVSRIITDLLESGPGSARLKQGWPALTTHVRPLEVIGDKAGWDAVNEYVKRGANSSLISEFGEFIGIPVKTIVTLRHPLDNIGSWSQGRKYKAQYPGEAARLHILIKRHRRFYKAAWEILQGTDYFMVHHEDLIERPNHLLQELSDWLELPHDREWRRACGNRIWSNPRLRRSEVNWSPENLKTVEDFIQEHPIMEYYRE